MNRIEIKKNYIYEFYANQKISEDILEKVKNLEWVKNLQNSRSKINTLYEISGFEQIHVWFLTCVYAVLHDLKLDIKNITITQSWANKTLKSEEHHEHIHPNSFISGVFFLSSFEDDDFDNGRIVFSDFMPSIWSRSPFSWGILEKTIITPKFGKLLIFPSNLQHKTLINKSDSPRYSISFNSFPEGIISTKSELQYLNLKTEGFKI